MEDILRHLIAILRADAGLAAMLGGTSRDTRIYLFYRGDAEIAPKVPGFITVSLSGESVQGAVVGPAYTIAVWARTQDKLEPMAARVRYLLHKRIHTTDVDRRLYTKQVTTSDRFQPQSNFSSKTLQYTAYWLEIAKPTQTPTLSASVSETVGVDEVS